MDINAIMRTLHILSGAAWFGSVLVINFVLIPSLSKFDTNKRNLFITSIFPKFNKMASHLSIIAVLTGIHLVVSLTDADLSNLLSGRWGISILFGGSLGLLLTLNHFFVEKRIAKKIYIINASDDENNEKTYSNLKVVQRFSFVTITIIILLMINASRGLF